MAATDDSSLLSIELMAKQIEIDRFTRKESKMKAEIADMEKTCEKFAAAERAKQQQDQAAQSAPWVKIIVSVNYFSIDSNWFGIE